MQASATSGGSRRAVAVGPGRARLTAATAITWSLADIFPDLAYPSFQDHANEAIHRFIT